MFPSNSGRSTMPVGPSIEHEINVRAPASTVHDAIATRAGLQGWNTSRVTGDGAVGSEWILSYVGGPDFVWRVDRDDASGVRWTCTRGPGGSVGTTVEFALAPTQDGRTRISLTHGGWPHREGNFTKCNTLWGAMLFQLKAFAESGKPAPAHG
jgi:uncharacterized protein YndB with AHSA1/START domain